MERYRISGRCWRRWRSICAAAGDFGRRAVMTGAELRASRQQLSLTQVQLAAALDLQRDSIIRYESGKWPIPQVVEMAVELLVAIEPTKT
jgi:DNA-binding XRE family transcriptional regulator